MSSLHAVMESLAEYGPQGIAQFQESLDPEWIDAALQATGTASIRRRKLPAEQAVWLVLGMSLLADRSICSVVEHLDLVLPSVHSLASSAIPQARSRLGAAPMKYLFEKVAQEYANSKGLSGYCGFSLHAVDSTCMRLQDSDDNFAYFGKPGGRNGKSDAGYPQLRVATLMNLATRIIEHASFGPYATSEHTLARVFWAEIPDKSITIMDRGFINYKAFIEYIESGAEKHILVRMKSKLTYQVLEILPDGSILATIHPTASVKRENQGIRDSLTVRIIEYQHDEGKPCRIMTTLIDHVKYSAKSLIELYHERWEIEISYDEIKTHMLETKECLRSKKPVLVEQELWGLLLTYNLVRREMLLAAEEHQLPPARISFRSSLLWIRNFWLTAWRTNPYNIPKHLGQLRSTLDVLILPERRSKRRYPRHVKIKMSNFKRNRGNRILVDKKA